MIDATTVLWVLLAASFFVSVYALSFPLLLPVLTLGRKPNSLPTRPSAPEEKWPIVTVMVPIHGSAAGLTEKLASLTRCNYPQALLDILVLADGPIEGAAEMVADFDRKNQSSCRLVGDGQRRGKNAGLVNGARVARGEILMITDSDALMDQNSITAMVAALEPDDIGGACGLHVISTKGLQSAYWDSESRLKEAEMQLLGSITASYGTILAVKRELFPDLPAFVTDDLFLALSVVRVGKRFVYASDAIVYIEQPSRHPHSEFRRRRRIVCRSLWGLWINRCLLNPVRQGAYAVCLASHKLLRRLLPLFLIAGVVLSAILAARGSVFAQLLLALQLAAYSAGVIGWWLSVQGIRAPGPLRTAAFFVATNVGLTLGITDFLRGRRVATW